VSDPRPRRTRLRRQEAADHRCRRPCGYEVTDAAAPLRRGRRPPIGRDRQRAWDRLKNRSIGNAPPSFRREPPVRSPLTTCCTATRAARSVASVAGSRSWRFDWRGLRLTRVVRLITTSRICSSSAWLSGNAVLGSASTASLKTAHVAFCGNSHVAFCGKDDRSDISYWGGRAAGRGSSVGADDC
jgi:hypothetical protein